EVGVETVELLLQRQESLGVLNRRGDLEAIANNSRMGEQSFHFGPIVFRDSGRIEIVKGKALVDSFFQDGLPTQPRLGTFEDQEFKQRPVVVQRNTPFGVVIA